MNDHERFLLLAAQRIDEPLTREADAELEAHLSSCPSCRAAAAGMRRDDIRLRAVLSPVAVAPRVRTAVLAEASGRRRRAAAWRLLTVLAAAIVIAVIGVPLIAGGPGQGPGSGGSTPSQASIPTASPTPSPTPPPTDSPTPSVEPSQEPSPSTAAPSPVVAGSVNGQFIYSEFEPRRGSISAGYVDGAADGAWSRRVPPAGNSKIWNGTITCLVIDGDEAWMAGPVKVSADGETNQAIFILARDRGPQGEGDRVLMQLSTSGETLALFEGWCREKFRPRAPYPLTDGDIRIDTS